MYRVRRCSSLIQRDLTALCFLSPVRAAKKSQTAFCRVGFLARSPFQLNNSRLSSSVHVYQMGSSSVRPFSTLVQTRTDVEENDLAHVDHSMLLRKCEEVLRNRPARPHRDFTRSTATPPQDMQIRVMQWNILAQALGEGKDCFVRCPVEALNWAERKYLILEEILTYRPDIVCLQEVDHYYDTIQPMLSSLGYESGFCPKPCSPCLDVQGNNGPDGCALFFNCQRFRLLSAHHLRLSAMAFQTNQVAIVATLECGNTGRLFCTAVTHLKARSGWETLRAAQGSNLLQQLKVISRRESEMHEESIPLLICGDLNAEPDEEVYKRFLNSPLGLDSAYRTLSVDGTTEPCFTTWKIRPSGESRATLDYIWYSRHGFSVNSVLNMPSEEQIGPDRLPSYHYPSDHLSLVCDLSFLQKSQKLM